MQQSARRRAPHAAAILLALALVALAPGAHGRGHVAAPRGPVGEWRAAALLVPAHRRRWRRGRRRGRPGARAARCAGASVPIARALHAPLLAVLAPVAVHRG